MDNNSGVTKFGSRQLEILCQTSDNLPLPFSVKDLDRRYLFVNQAYANSLNRRADEIIGKNDIEIGMSAELVKGINAKGIWDLDDQAIAEAKTRRADAPNKTNPHNAMRTHGTIRLPIADNAGNIIALATFTDDERIESLQDTLDVRDDQLTVLHSLMTDLLTDNDLELLLQEIAEIMTSYTDATNAIILLVDETAEYIQVVASSGSHSGQNMGVRRERGIGFAGVAWETQETQYIADSDENSLTKDYWPSETQLLAVPLKIEEEVIGVAVLGTPCNGEDFSHSTSVVNNLASIASIAIATAKLLDKSKKELKHSRGLSEISNQMNLFDDLDELYSTVAYKLVESFDFSRCTFFQVTEDGDLYSAQTWTNAENGIEANATLPPEIVAESANYWAFKKNESVLIPRKTDDPRESVQIHKLRSVLNIGCSVSMPIRVNRKVVAVLFVCKDIHRQNCDENELNLLTSIVQQISTAIYGINASAAVKHQAYHDSLTGLPNRRYFEEQIQSTINEHADTQKTCTLLFLDLDGFKTVNDTLGHTGGDQLLQLVAERLRRCVGKNGTIARIGGDEFAVILTTFESQQYALRQAQRIRKAILDPFSINDSVANIGTSIGLCFFPADGDSVDELLTNADQAMYQAKAKGKNNVVRFEQSMADSAQQRIRIEAELHDALDNNEFVIHYQPQVDPRHGIVRGLEALVRWQHPLRGIVPPHEFVPIAEETGLINEIGSWVLTETISQIAKWKNTRLCNIRVSVNIAANQFLNKSFTSRIEQTLKHNNVSPAMLELELTESVVMKDINQVAARLFELRELGVTIALDDFGTGYSSLSYLQDLPLDVLKIDRAFVARLTDKKTDYSLVNTIMLLASGLGLETVAEGVENDSQLNQIVELGCTLIQGFYYSRPCPLEELEETVVFIEEQFDIKKAS